MKTDRFYPERQCSSFERSRCTAASFLQGGIPYVSSHNYDGGRLAVEKLIKNTK